MEQVCRALSPPRSRSSHSAKRLRRPRDQPEYIGIAHGGAVSFSYPSQVGLQQATNVPQVQPHSMPPQALLPTIPSIPPSLQPSTNPSPTQSRPASVSMSVAHPQAYPAGPPNQSEQPVQWRRASSLSSPFNPYYPTPVASTTLHIMMVLVHLGILIVLSVLLSDLRKTTSTFHTVSNNGTGSYLRVGLYGGGLGSINKPFYVGGLGNSTAPVVTVPSGGRNASTSTQPDASALI